MNTITRINTIEQLQEVSAKLHDARFLKSDIGFQGENGIFSLTGWALSTSTNDSWRSFILSFFNVEDVRVQTREEVSYYELATINVDLQQHRINLVTHYAMEIILRIGEFNAELVETEEGRPGWRNPSPHVPLPGALLKKRPECDR